MAAKQPLEYSTLELMHDAHLPSLGRIMIGVQFIKPLGSKNTSEEYKTLKKKTKKKNNALLRVQYFFSHWYLCLAICWNYSIYKSLLRLLKSFIAKYCFPAVCYKAFRSRRDSCMMKYAIMEWKIHNPFSECFYCFLSCV